MRKWQVNRDQYSVEVDLGPESEWVAEMQWPEGQTQGGPAMLVIYPSDPETCPPGGLSQTVLRDVDFKRALEELRSSLASSEQWKQRRQRNQDKLVDLLVAHADEGLTPEYLALLARVYVGAVNRGQEKPLEYLATTAGKSAAAIKNHLWQATRKGYLERSPGRAGGKVTGKSADVLETILNTGLESLSATAKRIANGQGTGTSKT